MPIEMLLVLSQVIYCHLLVFLDVGLSSLDAVISYVTDDWAKSDEGITQHLKVAVAMLKSEPDQQEKCQQMANTFLTHRQMSEAEAFYKMLPNLIQALTQSLYHLTRKSSQASS